MYKQKASRLLKYHHSMVFDEIRTQSFKQAIDFVVKPGDVVLDLGCGSGILTCFACQAGASRVYAIESEVIIGLAQSISKANGYAEKVVFINELSTNVNLPEQVDVIISETIGNVGFDEGILGWILDAKERFLRPDGIIIPQSIAMIISPIDDSIAYHKIADWDEKLFDLDLSAGKKLAANNLFWERISQDDLLSVPTPIVDIDLGSIEKSEFIGTGRIRVEKAGTICGIAGWFGAKLTTDQFITNQPNKKRSSWKQAYFPIEDKIHVQVGDYLDIDIRCKLNGSVWVWQINHFSEDPAIKNTYSQTSVWGSIFSTRKLFETSSEQKPIRNEKAEILISVLNAMDGSQSIEMISQKLMDAYPKYYKTKTDALSYVKEISRQFHRGKDLNRR